MDGIGGWQKDEQRCSFWWSLLYGNWQMNSMAGQDRSGELGLRDDGNVCHLMNLNNWFHEKQNEREILEEERWNVERDVWGSSSRAEADKRGFLTYACWCIKWRRRETLAMFFLHWTKLHEVCNIKMKWKVGLRRTRGLRRQWFLRRGGSWRSPDEIGG